MFLWASLAWSFFIEGVGMWTAKRIRERMLVLQHLPPGMESLYRRIHEEVEPCYRHDLRHSLQLIVSAIKPLSLDEIAIALSLMDRPQRWSDIDVRLNPGVFFQRACPHLIKINENNMVSLIHLSCKDYLVEIQMTDNQPNTFHIDKTAANLGMGLDCLSYVGLDDFAKYDLGRACGQFQFLSYAHQYWIHHLRDSSDQANNIWRYLYRIFDSETKGFRWYDNSELVIQLWNHGLLGLLEIAARPPFNFNLNVIDAYSGDHFIHIVVADIRQFPLDILKSTTGLGLDINGRTRFGQTLLHRCIKDWQDENTSILQREECGN